MGQKNINYGKRFDYRDSEEEYTFKLKKHNWWWLLLLLLLLPLLLLLKCCDREEDEKSEPVMVHVIDCDTKEDIADATVVWEEQSLLSSSHSLRTDANGCGTLDGVDKNEHIMLRITARAEGYADTIYNRVRIPADLERDGTVIIKMRPLSEDFHADIVMCIDNTGSMSSLLNMVKTNALNFHKDLKSYCAKNKQSINDIRVRVIAFGDFGDSRYSESGLLRIPDQTMKFQNFVNSISLTNGGDGPEDGLEALALAIKTPWERKATRRRHIIIIYTDAAAHPLGTTSFSLYYPKGMPRDKSELTSLWNSMDPKARRLVLFAPDDKTWNSLESEWDNVVHEKKNLRDVLSGKGYNKILEAISKSL